MQQDIYCANESFHLAPGAVALVGAGPGDPDLLTIKAAKAIRSATVIFVDDLVSPAIVAMARPSTRVVNVGKRGGCKSTPQSFIEKLMIAAANAGECVVRLKGGDPLIFGRGGEEVESLQSKGISVCVINGITSGLAAASSLNVSLTHREYSQGVVFVTGHSKSVEEKPNWKDLGQMCFQNKLTLVIYMGISNVAQIASELSLTLRKDTPVAIVQDIGLPSERHCVCTLDTLSASIASQAFVSPSVIVVGEVIRGLAEVQARQHRLEKYSNTL